LQRWAKELVEINHVNRSFRLDYCYAVFVVLKLVDHAFVAESESFDPDFAGSNLSYSEDFEWFDLASNSDLELVVVEPVVAVAFVASENLLDSGCFGYFEIGYPEIALVVVALGSEPFVGLVSKVVLGLKPGWCVVTESPEAVSLCTDLVAKAGRAWFPVVWFRALGHRSTGLS